MSEQERLQSLFRERFQLAENYVKSAEIILRPVQEKSRGSFREDRDVSGPLIPAVNQLRYAGFHASKAYGDSRFDEEELKAAIRHCERAIYDILDSQLQFYMFECLEFKRDYRTIEIHDIVKTYIEDCHILENIKNSPTERDSENRDQEWRKKEGQVWQVYEVHKRWDIHREELNKRVKKERRTLFLELAGLLIAVAGIVAGAMFACCKGCK